jgi:hypothetical protein
MALIIEDGSGVAGANSYISVTNAKAYAAARGLTIGTVDAAIEILLTKALDYIEALRGEFQGSKTDATQALQWPRAGAYLDGVEIEDDEIPAVLPMAQAQLAVDAYTLDLMPVGDGRAVVRERVEGAVEVQYDPGGNTNAQPSLTAAMALLEPLLESAIGGGLLSSLRV